MRRTLQKYALVAGTAVLAAAPVFSAAAQDSGSSGGTNGDVITPVLWTLGGLLVTGVVLGVFQALKRQLGGFENPEWVAPIGAVFSKDLPQDPPAHHDDEHDEHDAHDAHEPALTVATAEEPAAQEPAGEAQH